MNHYLRVLLTPACWVRIFPVSEALDYWMNKALDNPTFEELNEYTVKLNGVKLWIANYPYAFGYLYNVDKGIKRSVPSRRTVFRLYDAIRAIAPNNESLIVAHLKERDK